MQRRRQSNSHTRVHIRCAAFNNRCKLITRASLSPSSRFRRYNNFYNTSTQIERERGREKNSRSLLQSPGRLDKSSRDRASKMTSSCDIQLTPGQKCLLDLLQRKLLNTVQSYSKLSIQKRSLESTSPSRNNNNNNNNINHNHSVDDLDSKLLLLKDRIRRLSAKQKRFTYEIISGNGNNTIPKESFFEALGLLTKEALAKLNSKTKERRRRTTANPRFSHEAIQARRIVNSKKPPANKSSQQSQNSTASQNAVAASPIPEGLRTNRRELLQQYNKLQKEIDSRTNQIHNKRQSNEKIAHQNELIRSDMMNILNTQIQWRCDESLEGLD